MKRSRLPLGFDEAGFTDLVAELHSLLPELAPASPLVAQLTGSCVAFLSPHPRQPPGHSFDARGTGTTDVQIELFAPALAATMESVEAPYDPFVWDISADLPAYRFYENHAGGLGLYDLFPSLGLIAEGWGHRLGRVGGVHIYLRTVLAAPPPPRGIPGEPIEVLRVEGGASFAPARPCAPLRRLRVDTVEVPLDRLGPTTEGWSLRDHDYYGPYLRQVRSPGSTVIAIRTRGAWRLRSCTELVRPRQFRAASPVTCEGPGTR